MNTYLKNSRGMGNAKAIAIIILLGVFTVFILQNTAVVEIKFLFWQLTMSRVLVLLGSLFIGVLIGLLVGWEKSKAKAKKFQT